MGGLVKAADRRLARHLGPGARKRLAAVAGGRVLGWYRRRRSDVVLVSFPKCGRTWLRVMVGRSLQRHFALPDEADVVELAHLAELDRRVPSVLVTHDDDAQWKAPAEVERDKDSYRHRRVILLVRDPRDVIVSLYHQMGGRRGEDVGSLGEFVGRPAGGFASLLAFYDAWAGALDVPAAVLLVRYEDLHADPGAQLRRVLAFVGVRDVDAVTVGEAVEYGSFANMRRLEDAGASASSRLRPVGDAYKTRRGTVGGHREELEPEEVAHLDTLMAASPGAARFGYRP
ncbi:MAG TPA: sulfotransferase domain-containing protein [Acidimicrobiales bacterium]|nr:sulfotransferase domain-containing protein [Acidimicrobiales bacterium]